MTTKEHSMVDEFTKFTSIDKFANTWKMMQRMGPTTTPFRSKIKLHGTNAAIRIVDGKVTSQKRKSDLGNGMDNFGFDFWQQSINWNTSRDMIIDGEWAGPGVQKTDAVSQIPNKKFFVFGIRLPAGRYTEAVTLVDPEIIKQVLPEDDNIVVLPYYNDQTFYVNSEDHSTAVAYQKWLEEEILKIGEEDPFIKDYFGISGAGEGLVCFPDVMGIVPTDTYNTYVFKVKSEAHREQKTKSPASVGLEIPADVYEFVENFVTVQRFEHMMRDHCDNDFKSQNIGVFLKALAEDVRKESVEELAANTNIDFKAVCKVMNPKALKWFKSNQGV